MEFRLKYTFPVIIIILGIVSIFFLTKIDPFNLVIAAVVFVIAGIMIWRIYYDFSSVPEKTEVEYAPSGNVSQLMKDSPKEAESKMKLDDFLKSSPKSISLSESKNQNPFSSDSNTDLEYKKMKAEALKELKGVIKPSMKKPVIKKK